MRNDKRQESLEKIKTDPIIKVILISFKSGSTGESLYIIIAKALQQADRSRSQPYRLQQRSLDGPLVEPSVSYAQWRGRALLNISLEDQAFDRAHR
jgi:hypothetical protein